MQIVICKRCKKLFQYKIGERICLECKKEEDELFYKVKEYLLSNRRATIEELSESTGVSVKLIQKFLREGRLEIVPDSNIKLNCERCGAKIFTGRFCNGCRAQINEEISKITNSMAPKHVQTKTVKEKMHFQPKK